MIRARLDGHLLDGVHSVADLEHVTVAAGQVLWVHCEVPDDAEIDAIASRFHVHPLAVEDLRNSNQRPKLDDYGDQLFVVLFGAIKLPDGTIGLAEVHFLIGDGYLVTVSTEQMPAIDVLEKQLDVRPELCGPKPDMMFYRICDSLVDSVFPLLDHIGTQIDDVEDAVLENPDRETLRTIFGLKRDLLTLRRVTGPQRDLLQSLTTPRTPRIGDETQLFLRDVYDHTVRIAEQVDSFRDLVSGSLDAYLTSISNRLGEQTRRLTVVATIFLPLTFLTGFFGMNFAFLVTHIDSPLAFFIGLAVMAVSVPTLVLVVTRLNRRAAPLPPERHTARHIGLLSAARPPAAPAKDAERSPSGSADQVAEDAAAPLRPASRGRGALGSASFRGSPRCGGSLGTRRARRRPGTGAGVEPLAQPVHLAGETSILAAELLQLLEDVPHRREDDLLCARDLGHRACRGLHETADSTCHARTSCGR